MRKLITFILFILMIPLATAITAESANYRIDFTFKPSFEASSESVRIISVMNPESSSLDQGVYQGYLMIPTTTPLAEVSAVIGGGGAASVTQRTLTDVEEEIKKLYCAEDASFINRLFSKCKLDNDGVCQDGENFILDSDCKVTLKDVKTGDLFRQMWFLRFVFLLAIFMLFKDSKKFPIVVAVLIGLFLFNGAFNNGVQTNERTCSDLNFLLNFGPCTFPSQPMVGWGLLLALVVLVVRYATGAAKPAKPVKKRKL